MPVLQSKKVKFQQLRFFQGCRDRTWEVEHELQTSNSWSTAPPLCSSNLLKLFLRKLMILNIKTLKKNYNKNILCSNKFERNALNRMK